MLNMTFNVGYAVHGFRDGNERPEFARSGTFFEGGFFPYIGYNNSTELDDPRRRRDEHLSPA
jgi:ABC-2 type transport system permease protein